jgi:hypothetical protein
MKRIKLISAVISFTILSGFTLSNVKEYQEVEGKVYGDKF